MSSGVQGAGHPAFRVSIELSDVQPTIWRQIVVSGTIRLAKLADILLVVMGWSNSHLHQFRIGDTLFGMHVEDWPEEEIDEKSLSVVQAIGGESGFWFDYDFGDGWEHRVEVQERSWTSHSLKFAVCMAGENACPPDDIGGPGGYEEFLDALNDPSHPEHLQYLEWIGGSFDPTFFDVTEANAALQRLR